MKSRLFPLILIAPLLASCKAHAHNYEVINVEVQSTPENPNIGIRTIKCSGCGDTKREENCSINDTAFTGYRSWERDFNISEETMNTCKAKDSFNISAYGRNIFVFNSGWAETVSEFKTFRLIVRSFSGSSTCSRQFSQVKMFDKDFKYTDSSWELYWELGMAFLSKETYPIERLGEPFYFDLINGDDGLNCWTITYGLQFYK